MSTLAGALRQGSLATWDLLWPLISLPVLGNCVYVFWSGRKCEYVGRALRGKGRPFNSFEKYWFTSVTRVDIYSVATPTVVPKAECFAIHIFEPRRNAISSSRPKFSKRCPICATDRQLRRELNAIFPSRSWKKRKRK